MNESVTQSLAKDKVTVFLTAKMSRQFKSNLSLKS